MELHINYEHKVFEMFRETGLSIIESETVVIDGIVKKPYNRRTCRHGNGPDFIYGVEKDDQYIIYGHFKEIDGNIKYISISSKDHDGECPSGYTTATTAYLTCKYIKNLPTSFTKVPKNPILLNINDYKYNRMMNEIETNVFTFSPDGGDIWYPEGYFIVNHKLFTDVGCSVDKKVSS